MAVVGHLSHKILCWHDGWVCTHDVYMRVCLRDNGVPLGVST
jgi:hypothetical protein